MGWGGGGGLGEGDYFVPLYHLLEIRILASVVCLLVCLSVEEIILLYFSCLCEVRIFSCVFLCDCLFVCC